ncbi:hypothetical protein [Flavobacterium microcysteis]|uniref:hypothetical protein n=1 Tax=Flavobacterium microcysteis TaxID=2596891 RepID=UPI0013159E64|nr:hypothetical protein [Flavobacterium microcysteis]
MEEWIELGYQIIRDLKKAVEENNKEEIERLEKVKQHYANFFQPTISIEKFKSDNGLI